MALNKRPLPEPLTETCKNQRLRLTRREVWWKASRLMQYWRARLDWHSALQCGQSHGGVADANSFPSADEENRFALVEMWRAANVKLILTPAPDAAAVAWKRAQLRANNAYTGVKSERIERAIAEDVAFLAAHPTKKSKPMSTEAKERRRNFKEAMRRRIKDIAASRDIPDHEIRPVLSLRHRHIGEFVTKYGVNLEWLLEGEGRIFKTDPITLNPNMTGSEFAAVVATLPVAEQQAIRAKARELLQERDQ
jgi:hypothetical protein